MRYPNAWVLDASVAAKWFLPPEGETLVSEASRVLSDHVSGGCRLIVPDLFWPEVANIFWKAARTGRITSQIAEDALQGLAGLGLETRPSPPLVGHAIRLALNTGRPAYDAFYVTLAVITGLNLLTADERLVNALGSRFPVIWLGRLGTAGANLYN